MVAAIVEKFGYLNLPLRNHGLHDYLVGKRSLPDDAFLSRFTSSLKRHSNKVRSGGVNIPDRDDCAPIVQLNAEVLRQELPKLWGKKYTRISSLFGDLYRVGASALEYKQSYHQEGRVIVVSTDFHRYPVLQLCGEYQKEFGSVRFIALHRDFPGWLESIASQRFSNPRKRAKFRLDALYRRYAIYDKAVRDLPGLHVNFNSLFGNQTSVTINKISKYINEDCSNISWESEYFDLFGQLRNYNSTFIKADYEGRYLSASTRWLISYMLRKKTISRLDSLVLYPFYWYDAIQYLRHTSR